MAVPGENRLTAFLHRLAISGRNHGTMEMSHATGQNQARRADQGSIAQITATPGNILIAVKDDFG
jgi:hypothetical protein